MTPFQRLCDKYKNGCGSPICKLAYDKAFYRGRIPCDVLFIGEAPGDSEDCNGIPFDGPAGQLLDRMIEEAMAYGDDGKPLWTWGMTNLLLCKPVDPETGDKVHGAKLDPEDVHRCSPRLREQIRICRPKLIFAVGAQPRDWLDPKYSHSVLKPPRDPSKPGVKRLFAEPVTRAPQVHIAHPSGILQDKRGMQHLMYDRNVVTIRDAVEEHVL